MSTPRTRKTTTKAAQPAGRFALAYAPGTDLARRYPAPTTARWTTHEAADVIRRAMPNADQVDVVEIEDPR